MKYAIAIVVSSSVACLVGCASTPQIAVSEGVGPALRGRSETPGNYEVKANACGFGLVTIPVVIEPGKLTMVNLQRGENPVVASVASPTRCCWMATRLSAGGQTAPLGPTANNRTLRRLPNADTGLF